MNDSERADFVVKKIREIYSGDPIAISRILKKEFELVRKEAEQSKDEKYYEACEKITLSVIEQMRHSVFSRLEIDGQYVKIVFAKNGISFNQIDQFFH